MSRLSICLVLVLLLACSGEHPSVDAPISSPEIGRLTDILDQAGEDGWAAWKAFDALRDMGLAAREAVAPRRASIGGSSRPLLSGRCHRRFLPD